MALQKFLLIVSMTIAGVAFDISAQTTTTPPPPVPVRMGLPSSTPEKIPGATVRGRLVYEDTGAPIRYALIGFIKAGELGGQRGAVRTDEEGNFVYDDLAAGDYYPVIQNRGILNPEVFLDPLATNKERIEKLDTIFQRISVAGTGEFEFFLRAKRGATISGTIRYFDGEPAVGVKVDAIPLKGEIPEESVFSGISPTSEVTDDRGFYRFAGLREGRYVVRVTEPVSHKSTKSSQYAPFESSPFTENPFQTYFQRGSSPKNADRVDAYYGRTTEGVNITLPERTLYDISGIVVREDTGELLENFQIRFVPIPDVDADDEESNEQSAIVAKFTALAMSSISSMNFGSTKPSHWSVLNVPKGKYRLAAIHQTEYRDRSEPVGDKPIERFPTVYKEIEVADADLSGIRIEIPAGGSISGTIATSDGKNLPSYLSVSATDEETGTASRVSVYLGAKEPVVASGLRKFEFGKLTAGTYRLDLFGRDHFVKEVTVNGERVEGGLIEIENGKDVTGVQIVLSSDMGVIKGTVEGHSPDESSVVLPVRKGQDIASLFSSGTSRGVGMVAPDGTFTLKVAPGEYSLVVLNRSEVPRDPFKLIVLIRERAVTAKSVSVAAKETKTITLETPRRSK